MLTLCRSIDPSNKFEKFTLRVEKRSGLDTLFAGFNYKN